MTLDNVEDVYPLSPLQAGMLYHAIAEPDTGVYVNQIVATIDAPPTFPATFEARWARMVERHAVLRTAFLWDGLDEPLQVVHQYATLPWQHEDGRDHDHDRHVRRLDALLVEDRRRGFDPASAPVMRMTLLRLSDTRWQWLWSFHHLILDGWSARLLLDELRQGPDDATPMPYRDFIAWHGQQDHAAAERFWRRRLGGFASPIRVEDPLARARPAGAFGPLSVSRALPAVDTNALTRFATQHNLTSSTVVQGAWALLLGRISRSRDVVFGVTHTTRPPTLPLVEQAVGLFINTLPARVDVDPAASLVPWLRQLQQAQLEAQAFDFSPLDAVQRWSGVAPGQALFDSLVVFENHPNATPNSAPSTDWTLGAPRFVEQSNVPLALLVVPGPRLALIVVVDSTRFDAAFAERMVGQMAQILHGLVRDPDQPLGRVPWLRDDERAQLIAIGKETDHPSITLPTGTRIHDLVRRVTAQAPDLRALVTDDETVTYGELAARVRPLAHHLRHLGVRPGTLVGLHVPRSVHWVVGMLAILEGGGAYVPLDPSYPAAHLRSVFAETGAPVLLTCGSAADDLGSNDDDGSGRHAVSMVQIDDPTAWHHVAPPDSPDDSPDPGDAASDVTAGIMAEADDLAYVIHTSGSSGAPKGVMVSHRALVQSTAARLSCAADGTPTLARRRFLLLSPLAFDSAVAGLFGTLCAGGTLVLPPPGLERDLEGVHAAIRRHRVTHTLCLPALYGLLLRETDPTGLASLEAVAVAGEACPPTLAALHDAKLPAARLTNEYGPTEATVWVTAHRVTRADAEGPVPIGRPVASHAVFVLDDQLDPVPMGVAGELYVAGNGLARGYLGRPAETAERFVPLPGSLQIDRETDAGRRAYRTGDVACWRPDGRLVFLGRADQQVKVRGHRIETEGLAARLQTHPAVAEAAVAVRRAGQRPRLVAYIVPAANEPPPATRDLRAHWQAGLPAYQVPDDIVTLARIPRRPNGKLDTRALPDPASTTDADGLHPDQRAPRNAIEEAMAATWSSLLGIPSFGVHDHFHALGGDSILAIQAVSRMRQAGFAIEPRDLAEHPTIAGLARITRARRDAEFETASAPPTHDQEPITGPAPLTPMQRWFFNRGLTAPAHWNQSRLFVVPAEMGRDDNVNRLRAALNACWTQHDMLRARFASKNDDDGNGAWHQTIVAPDQGELPLTVVDLPADAGLAAATETMVHVQAGFDLTRGPLAAALLMRRGPTQPGWLLWAVHHLVIDAVSWSILIDDLTLAYREGPNRLPAKTASYLVWAQPFTAEASTAKADPIDLERLALPLDHTTEHASDGTTPATEADADTVRLTLDADRTRALAGPALVAFDVTVDEMLITALLLAVQRWRGHGGLHVELERHGRDRSHEAADTVLDVSRTVGWFTRLDTVVLDAVSRIDAAERASGDQKLDKGRPSEDGLGRALLAVRRQLRDALGTAATTQAIHHQPGATAPLLFNNLGREATPSRDALLQPIEGADATSRDPRNGRSHTLEVNAVQRDGQLMVDWIFARTLHARSTIERVARHVRTTLEALVDYGLTDGLVDGLTDGLAVTSSESLPPSRAIDEVVRLTALQESLLVHRLQRGKAADSGFLLVTATLEGALDPATFTEAWRHTVACQTMLRSAVRWQDVPHPVHVVSADVALPLRHEDWRTVPMDEHDARWTALADAERRAGLNLETAPAWRVVLVRTADHTHRVLWACHHLLLDGWSSGLILDQILRRINAMTLGIAEPTPPSAPTFRAYVDSVRSDTRSTENTPDPSAFWHQTRLRPGDLARSHLPSIHELDRRNASTTGATTEPTTGADVVLPAITLDRAFLDGWARHHEITPSCLFVGCWGLVLSEATARSRTVFGLTVSGRTLALDGIEHLVGMVANALPVPVDVERDDDLGAWFRTVLADQQALQPFESIPLGRLLQAGGYTSRRSPFDSLLAFANYPGSTTTQEPTTVRLTDVSGDVTSVYPLTVTVEPGTAYRLGARHDPARLEASVATALLARFAALIEAVVEGSTTTVGTLLDTARHPLPAHLAPREAVPPVAADRYVDPRARNHEADLQADAETRSVDLPSSPAQAATEGQLMRIWNDLIAYQEIRPSDNFFELGGHSLLVPPLIERIERDLGVAVPLAAVFAHPTLRALATVVGGQSASPSWPSLVAIRAQGTQPPLYLVHGLGGEVSWFYSLAPYLPTSRPLFGLQAPAEPFTDLVAMARAYVRDLRAHQPTGPYCLGGYCAGGNIAFEMAHQLRAEGETVAFLCLIDSVPQSHASGAPVGLPAMLYRRAKHLLRKRPGDIIRSTRDAARRARLRLNQRRSQRDEAPKPVELADILDMRSLPTVYHRAATRHFRAVRDHAPRPFAGDVWLFRSHDPRFGNDFGWGALTEGTLHIERIEGSHLEVLQEPHVASLGAKLTTALRNAGTGAFS